MLFDDDVMNIRADSNIHNRNLQVFFNEFDKIFSGLRQRVVICTTRSIPTLLKTFVNRFTILRVNGETKEKDGLPTKFLRSALQFVEQVVVKLVTP